jgi:N-acetylglutamate synthase-like GNAT family acetyltransferase
MRVATLAVHPAYWRRGHGTRLVRWCCNLADSEGVDITVSAAKMGVPRFLDAGFVEKELVTVEEYREHESIELWMGVRESRSPKALLEQKSRTFCCIITA